MKYEFPREPHQDQAEWSPWPPATDAEVAAAVTAEVILDTGSALVGGSRHEQHGNKTDNHRAIASLWNGYFRGAGIDVEVSGKDVACLMCLLKIARTLNGKFNIDDYVDAASYAAIAGEIDQIEAGDYP